MLLAAALPSSAVGIQPPRFAAAPGYAIPVIPLAVSVIDMTGDGRPDVVTASQGTVVSLLRNRGRRSFAPALNVSTGASGLLGDAVVADFDVDGFPDVATVSFNDGNGEGAVSVLINDAGHGFRAPVLYPQPALLTTSIAAGDVDGDGVPDLAITVLDLHTSKDKIGIMKNTGDGTFASPVFYPAAKSNGPCELVDVSGDGARDLVVVDRTQSLLGVLIGDGQGGFGAEVTYPAGTGAVSLALGDVNHDGAADAIVGGSSGRGSLLVNQGDGSFGPAVLLDLGAGSGAAYVTIADLQGDGNSDIAASSFNGWVTPVFGQGDGTFRRGARFGAGEIPEGIAAGDLDGDGRQDLAVIGNLGTMAPLFGTGGGRFQAAPPVVLSTDSLAVGAFAARDLSGDGLPDLAVGGGTGGNVRGSMPALGPSLVISLNQSGGRFGPPATYPFPWDPTGIGAGDFNGDGLLDLAVSLAANDTENVGILLGTGGGGFGAPSLLSIANFPADLAVGDFNGDGKFDFGLADFNSGVQTADVVVLPGIGDGTFGPAVKTTLGSGDPLGIVAADFNGDLVPDVGVLIHTNDLSDRVSAVTALGNGDGTFSSVKQYGLGKGLGELASADINRDGILDLVGSAPDSGGAVPLLGVGDGTFVPQAAVRIGTRPQWLAIADFTADGVPDLAIADQGGLLWALPGLGDGTFGARTAYASTTGPLAAADLDGNGTLDVAESQTYAPIVTPYFGLVP